MSVATGTPIILYWSISRRARRKKKPLNFSDTFSFRAAARTNVKGIVRLRVTLSFITWRVKIPSLLKQHYSRIVMGRSRTTIIIVHTWRGWTKKPKINNLYGASYCWSIEAAAAAVPCTASTRTSIGTVKLALDHKLLKDMHVYAVFTNRLRPRACTCYTMTRILLF